MPVWRIWEKKRNRRNERNALSNLAAVQSPAFGGADLRGDLSGGGGRGRGGCRVVVAVEGSVSVSSGGARPSTKRPHNCLVLAKYLEVVVEMICKKCGTNRSFYGK